MRRESPDNCHHASVGVTAVGGEGGGGGGGASAVVTVPVSDC